MSIQNNQTPVFVVFEGLDGSGKSTCARLVAERLDAELMTTPSVAVRAYREDLIASFAGCQEAHQLFYLSTVFAASARVRELLARKRSVVLDRYFLSTQAYAAFRGSRLAVDQLQSHLRPADLTVYLDVPLATRRARLSERHTTSADRETMRRDADAELRKTHVSRFSLPVVGQLLHLDADRLSPDEAAERVLDRLALRHPMVGNE
jgi:dTMP kinase